MLSCSGALLLVAVVRGVWVLREGVLWKGEVGAVVKEVSEVWGWWTHVFHVDLFDVAASAGS